MKRMIKATTNEAAEFLQSEAVEELMKNMEEPEKKLIGKLANSTDPEVYLIALVDTVESLGVSISEAFDTFLTDYLEKIQ